MYLTKFAKKVTVIHRRDELRAQKILQDRAFANEKMDFSWNNVVESFNERNGKIGSVTLKNTETGDIREHETDGAFVYIGMDPRSGRCIELGIGEEREDGIHCKYYMESEIRIAS